MYSVSKVDVDTCRGLSRISQSPKDAVNDKFTTLVVNNKAAYIGSFERGLVVLTLSTAQYHSCTQISIFRPSVDDLPSVMHHIHIAPVLRSEFDYGVCIYRRYNPRTLPNCLEKLEDLVLVRIRWSSTQDLIRKRSLLQSHSIIHLN